MLNALTVTLPDKLSGVGVGVGYCPADTLGSRTQPPSELDVVLFDMFLRFEMPGWDGYII